jgi:Glycine zipper
MKILHRTIGVSVVAFALALTTGCDTPSGVGVGALLGAGAGAVIGHATGNTRAGAMIGMAAGAVAGGVIGHINAQQRAQLQQQSPQTWQKIQYNDAVYAGAQPPPPPPPAVSQPASSAPAAASQPSPTPSAVAPQPASTPAADSAQQMQPLTVEDVKALAAAGVKDDVITAEIQKSNSKFSQHDISDLQQAGVSSTVIDAIKPGGT